MGFRMERDDSNTLPRSSNPFSLARGLSMLCEGGRRSVGRGMSAVVVDWYIGSRLFCVRHSILLLFLSVCFR